MIAVEKSLSESPFRMSDDKVDAIKEKLLRREAFVMDHRDLESPIETEGRELLRSLLQDHLMQRAQREKELGRTEPVVDARGQERTRQRRSERGLMSLFGPVRVPRRAFGAKDTESLHPLDAELNLPKESFSFGGRRRAAEEAARGSFDDAVGAVRATTGAVIAKRQLEELVVRSAQDFDAFYAMRAVMAGRAVHETGELLIPTTDAKGVVMRTEDLGKATKKAAQKRRRELHKRLAKARGHRARDGAGQGGGTREVAPRAQAGLGERREGPGRGDPGEVRRGRAA